MGLVDMGCKGTLGVFFFEAAMAVIHTYREGSDNCTIAHIISGRPAILGERRDYESERLNSNTASQILKWVGSPARSELAQSDI